jgi:D-alanyl-D-alanine carboxypeptidase/D-alanyl-D-alanine-endopeptidase (penicillin-binding protein 4)
MTASAELPASLTAALDQILARSALRGATVGLHVISLSNDRSLFAHDADRQMTPASNAKLLTSAAAIQVLGTAYEFRTTVGWRGEDLVVAGGGDPAVGGRFTQGDATSYFRRWATVLRERGVRHVAGDVVVDDSLFDRVFVHPRWPSNELNRWYAAPVCALSLNDNCVDVQITPGRELGSPALVRLVPPGSSLSVVNRTRTVSRQSDHAPRIWRRPDSSQVECSGNVYQGSGLTSGWVTVVDPALFFGAVLRQVLIDEGISVGGDVRRELQAGRDASFRALFVHRFPLTAALRVMNKESQNFYAEQIYKIMGATHGAGSWAKGREAAARALSPLGLEIGSYTLDDGSGLSRANRVSPRQITRLLAVMFHGEHGELFRQTLSRSGVDGTLARRLIDPPYRGRLWAKTGSIQGVRAISGYAQNRRGQWLAFSLLINQNRYSVRAVQDDVCKALVDLD